jgi:cytochrome c peroxidase
MKLLNLKHPAALIGLITLLGLITLITLLTRAPPEPTPAGDPLVAKGRELFFKETFDGNGRTCGTCHRAEDNLTIDAAFIATLPSNDPRSSPKTTQTSRRISRIQR